MGHDSPTPRAKTPWGPSPVEEGPRVPSLNGRACTHWLWQTGKGSSTRVNDTTRHWCSWSSCRSPRNPPSGSPHGSFHERRPRPRGLSTLLSEKTTGSRTPGADSVPEHLGVGDGTGWVSLPRGTGVSWEPFHSPVHRTRLRRWGLEGGPSLSKSLCPRPYPRRFKT